MNLFSFFPPPGTKYDRLKNLDVRFTIPPTDAGPITMAVFDDTCGNLGQVYQVKT